MINDENSRRKFLKKLALTVAGGVLSTTTIFGAEKEQSTGMTTELRGFLEEYEIWVHKFIDVIKKRKDNPNDKKSNDMIMVLSEEAETWKKQLQTYFSNEEFLEKYLEISKRVTNAII